MRQLVRPTQIRLEALRICISDCIQQMRLGNYGAALSHVTDAHTRICAMTRNETDKAEKSRKARVAGKLGGTMKAKNKLLRANTQERK